jgi:microcystin-dependent protein
MSDQYIGQIEAFSFGFAPRGWALCAGQLLAIAQNQALFALLGTTYGGDGVRTFALPNLQGRVAMGASNAQPLGGLFGEEGHTLTQAEVPSHAHSFVAVNNGPTGGTNVPGATVYPGSISTGGNATNGYSTTAPSVGLAPVAQSGNSQPHNNLMPYTTLNYCIALIGVFPSRN